ncbi:DUF624 domain-containing protein [Ruoffia halotolerans]|uniref:DUF624 domain-containing protein n=1 Tax=Ruoffia halotolerans TaxID=2748684 RepID=UPI0038B6A3C6
MSFLHFLPFLVSVNLLFILFSIPLITLFPSLFALVHVIDGYFSNDEIQNSSLFFRFKSAFKQLWRKSLKFGLIYLSFALIIGLDLLILNSITTQSPLVITFKYALIFLSLIIYCIFHFSLYIFANHSVTLKKSIIIGFLLTIKNPVMSLLIILAHLIIIVTAFFQPGLGLLLMFSAPIYIVNYVCHRFINFKEDLQ